MKSNSEKAYRTFSSGVAAGAQFIRRAATVNDTSLATLTLSRTVAEQEDHHDHLQHEHKVGAVRVKHSEVLHLVTTTSHGTGSALHTGGATPLQAATAHVQAGTGTRRLAARRSQ